MFLGRALWVCYPSDIRIELGALLLLLQGSVVGCGFCNREATATHGGQADCEENPGTWCLKQQPPFFPTYPDHTFVSETGMRYWCLSNYHNDRVVYIALCLSSRIYPSVLLAWGGRLGISPLLRFKQTVDIKACINLHHVYYMFGRCLQPVYGTARQKCEL